MKMSYWDRWAMWVEATAKRELYWQRYYRDYDATIADRKAKGLAVRPGGPYQGGPVDYSLLPDLAEQPDE